MRATVTWHDAPFQDFSFSPPPHYLSLLRENKYFALSLLEDRLRPSIASFISQPRSCIERNSSPTGEIRGNSVVDCSPLQPSGRARRDRNQTSYVCASGEPSPQIRRLMDAVRPVYRGRPPHKSRSPHVTAPFISVNPSGHRPRASRCFAKVIMTEAVTPAPFPIAISLHRLLLNNTSAKHVFMRLHGESFLSGPN